MENVLLDYKNRLFVQDFDVWERACNKDYCIDKKLGVQYIDNGIVLPSLPDNQTAGGVCDKNFNFKAGLFRNKVRGKYTPAWGGIDRAYRVDGEIKYDDRTVVFGGVLIAHFGHMMQDNLSRMWWVIKNRDSNLPLVFITTKGEYQDFFDKFWELLDIDKEKIIVITEPTQFKQVIVPEEAIHSFVEYYKEWLLPYDYISNNALSRYDVSTLPKKIYLTRTQYRGNNKGVYNEEYFENFYREHGYTVIAPEQYPIDYQIALAANADAIACTLGTVVLFNFFTKPKTRIDVLTRTTQVLESFLIGCQAKQADWYVIDPSCTLLFSDRSVGEHLLKPNKVWQDYVKACFNEDIELTDLDDHTIRVYLEKWAKYFIEVPQHFKGNSFDKLDAFDLFNQLCKSLFFITLDPKKYRTMPTKLEMRNTINNLNAELEKTKLELQKKTTVHSNETKDLANKLEKEKRANKITKGDYDAVVNSFSFKLGRFITFIPRKIRNLFRKKK